MRCRCPRGGALAEERGNPSGELFGNVSLEDASRLFSVRFPPTTGCKLELRATSCGRGLVATAPIAQGETLVSVPWRESVHVIENGHDDDLRLALALLDVLEAGISVSNDARVNAWREYRVMLPISTGAAAFWSSENVSALQLPEAVKKTSELHEKFKRYVDEVSSSSEVSPGVRSRADVMWALSMVHSRSFSVRTPFGHARALVPFADLFNHKTEDPTAARETDVTLSMSGRVNDNGTRDNEPWIVDWGTKGEMDRDDVRDAGADSAMFHMRSIWNFDVNEEVFITYGHETSAELLSSYGFFPCPNHGEYIRVYDDVQELLDDDRWVKNKTPKAGAEKEAVIWSALAVEAPLAIRPGGLHASAHLLGCLRVMHASGGSAEDDGSGLHMIRDEDVPDVGHSVFVWTEGGLACGAWARETVVMVNSDDVAVSRARARAVVDAAALGQAAARCTEMLEDLPTTLEEDEALLRELESSGGVEATSERMYVCDAESTASSNSARQTRVDFAQFMTALKYRISAKKVLVNFINLCRAHGVEPNPPL